MPLYEYQCFVCSQRFERIQKVSAEPVSTCPSCGGSVRRLLGSPALQFKGSGWYVTDYGKSNTSAPARGDSPAASSGKTKDESSSGPTEKAAGGESSKPAAPASTPPASS
jgi:putative FmdB family regulatory protein